MFKTTRALQDAVNPVYQELPKDCFEALSVLGACMTGILNSLPEAEREKVAKSFVENLIGGILGLDIRCSIQRPLKQ